MDPREAWDSLRKAQKEEPCPTCRGQGWIWTAPKPTLNSGHECPDCNGRGTQAL